MQTRAELEAERDRIQAMIDKREYADVTLEFQITAALRKWYLGSAEYGNAAKGIAAIARAHLLPIVPAGEARDGEFGFAWRSAREGWIAATRIKAAFMVVDATGSVFELSGNITHWLPASRVPGPEGAKS